MRLALEAGALVRTDRLVDDLWAADAVEHPPQHAAVEGRQAAPSARRSGVIVSGDGGYTLAVDPSEVDALAVLRPRRHRVAPARRRRRPRRRRPERVDTGDVPRRCAAGRRRRRVGHPAPGTARRGTDEARRDPVLGAVAARRRRRRDRRVGSGGGDVPVPGRPVGAADHRAVPSRTPGRRARRRTSGSGRSWPTSSASTPDRSCSSSSNRSCVHDASLGVPLAGRADSTRPREPAVDVGRARRARAGDRRRCPTCSRASGSSRSSDPAASGRPRVAIATGRTLIASDDAGAGGVWLARLESRDDAPTRSSTR